MKRTYDAAAAADACRVLVDRLWPRGVSKEDAALDAWVKEVAPSAALRRWFGHDPKKWSELKRRDFDELAERPGATDALLNLCDGPRLTLVFAAKDAAYNNAVALNAYLERYTQRDRPEVI